MPTYDYLCDSCGHKFELFQGINDKLVRKCPACKKLKLRRLFGTGAALVFKGSGFYQTDYRSDSYKKAAKADSNGESKPTSDGAGKPTSDGAGKPTSDGAGKSTSEGASKTSADNTCSGDKSSCKKCSD
jgi:putative FmdB family regulatory protein